MVEIAGVRFERAREIQPLFSPCDDSGSGTPYMLKNELVKIRERGIIRPQSQPPPRMYVCVIISKYTYIHPSSHVHRAVACVCLCQWMAVVGLELTPQTRQTRAPIPAKGLARSGGVRREARSRRTEILRVRRRSREAGRRGVPAGTCT